MKLDMFRIVPLSIIKSFFTVHSGIRKLFTNLYDIHHCWVYSE